MIADGDRSTRLARTAPTGPRRVIPAASTETNATVVERDDLTGTVLRLRVRPDGGIPTFRAGQYFALGLRVDGHFVQRPYSAASPPGTSADLEFLVRLVPGGALTPSLWMLGPGDRVRIGPPKGLFRLDPGDHRRHLFLATGTGIAPLVAMLAERLAWRGGGSFLPDRAGPPIIVHGVAHVLELVGRDRLERLAAGGAIVYEPAVSRPGDPLNAGWSGRTGRLDALVETIARDVTLDASAAVAYLCGNPAMITAVGPRLAAFGLPPAAIRSEQYWTPVDGAGLG
jgi:CDP-4-dehydro-6-deoxyglucose reductase